MSLYRCPRCQAQVPNLGHHRAWFHPTNHEITLLQHQIATRVDKAFTAVRDDHLTELAMLCGELAVDLMKYRAHLVHMIETAN